MSLDEVEHVDGCPYCDAQFIGYSPDEMREHMVDEHSPLAKLVCFPTEEARQRVE